MDVLRLATLPDIRTPGTGEPQQPLLGQHCSPWQEGQKLQIRAEGQVLQVVSNLEPRRQSIESTRSLYPESTQAVAKRIEQVIRFKRGGVPEPLMCGGRRYGLPPAWMHNS